MQVGGAGCEVRRVPRLGGREQGAACPRRLGPGEQGCQPRGRRAEAQRLEAQASTIHRPGHYLSAVQRRIDDLALMISLLIRGNSSMGCKSDRRVASQAVNREAKCALGATEADRKGSCCCVGARRTSALASSGCSSTFQAVSSSSFLIGHVWQVSDLK